MPKERHSLASSKALAPALLLAMAYVISNFPGGARAAQAGQQAPPAAPPATAPPAAVPPAPRTPQAAPPPAIRTTTRLVQVSVIAHDKHGALVTDLSQQDFRVFDNGQEQKISFFSKETTQESAGAGPSLPPNTWSNRAGKRGGAPVNLTVVLYDALNTRLSDQGRARQQVIHFLSQIKPEDRVALYFLGDTLRVLHDFTSDPNSLLRTLAKDGKYNGHLIADEEPNAAAEQSTGDDDLDLFIRESDVFFQQYKTTDRMLRTTDAFEAIGTHLASLPGRKSVFWVSGSFPLMIGYDATQIGAPGTTSSYSSNTGATLTGAAMPGADQRLFSDELERAARALNDANVAVYPVDARGLTMNMSAITQPVTARGRIRPDTPQSMSPDVTLINTMETLAQRTGGIAYHDNNDLAGAMRKAIEDSRVVYTLAFTPSHDEWNGEFRKLKVETSRPGVNLRYRSGYFAFPDKPVELAQKDQILAQAQWSILDATEIGLTVNALRVNAQGTPKISFAVLADPAGIRFTDAEGKKAADLVLTIGEKGADGKLVQEETKTMNLRLTEDRYRAVVERGLRLTGSMVLDPAAVQFRVVMLDTATGHLGSLEFPLAQLAAAMPSPGPAPAAAPTSAAPPVAAQRP